MLSMHEVLKNQLKENGVNSHKQAHISPSNERKGSQNEKHEDKQKSAIFTKRNIFIACYLICLVGCVYQMIEVLLLYFDYETVTTLSIEWPEEITPPDMSVCFPYISLINVSLLLQQQPHLYPIAMSVLNETKEDIDFNTHRIKNFKKSRGTFDWDFGVEIEKQLTIAEILKATVTLEDMFVECVVKSPESYIADEYKNLTECETIWDIDYFVKDENKCFRFSYQPIPGQDFVYSMERLSNTFAFRTLLHSLRINPAILTSGVERAYVYFHPRNRLPRGRIDPVLTFKNPAGNFSYSVTYSRISSTLLEAPYPTNCIDYGDKGFESKEHCIEQCIIKTSIERHGRAPYNLVFSKDSNLRVIGFKELDKNDTLIKDLESLGAYCSGTCKQPNCTNEYYTGTLLTKETGTFLKFLVETPSSLDTVTDLSPKLTFLEYIIYNTSVFGFWFGLCVLQIADAVEYVKEKRRAAKKLKEKLTTQSRKLKSQKSVISNA